MQAIILAGGMGLRMESPFPKPLVLAKGKPILSYQLDYFGRCKKIEKIVLALGQQAGKIKEFVGDNFPDLPVEFSVEKSPLGTGGALKLALGKASGDFVLVCNCDDLANVNLTKLAEKKENTICVCHPRLPFGRVRDIRGFARFEEKPILKDTWVSIGWYVLNRNQAEKSLADCGSLEYDYFPKIRLKLYKHQGFWQPLNSKKDLQNFESQAVPPCFK